MAYPSEQCPSRGNTSGALRVVLALVVSLILAGFILGPQLYLKKRSSAQASCPCDCDCSEEFAMPAGIINNSYADCGKLDPDTNEEMEKDFITLLSEEITLRRRVANESLEHTRSLTMDTRRTSSHYQNEAEKCNAQMENCEEARERAEAGLVEERKLTRLWEQRAREMGWKDNRSVYT